MSTVEIVLIAIGLSMDAFAVSIGKGLAMRGRLLAPALVLAVTFGLFQGLMPLLGWLLGSQFASFISSFDHWIAFGLLVFIGGKMLVEAIREDPDADEEAAGSESRLGLREVLVLGVATSIDALAAGIGFAVINVNIWVACGLIALITAAFSFVGVYLGRAFGARFERPAEILGGVILIAIGAKILLEHLGVIAF